MTAGGHIPVMRDDVVAALAPRDGALYVDGTFGGGGYSRAILDAAQCTVVGIDRDPDAIARGADAVKRYGGRLVLVRGRFGEMKSLLAGRGIDAVDGVTLDLGVSSMQLDEAERGFSFRRDGPLDMRMQKSGPSAADAINKLAEAELARIIREFGEDRRARRIARFICSARAEQPITRTGELADIVLRAAPGRRDDDIHPATRTFQALRIYVNDELGELESGLAGAEAVLKPRGRLAVVTFHSLEDRIVKRFLRRRSGGEPQASRHVPDRGDAPPPTFRLLFRRAARPSAEEISANPRARSARLRAAERTAAPAVPREEAA